MNDMKKVENYGIKWGPFTLKIPFIHIKFLTAEFLQGMVISGATAFAGAPVVMALGLSFEEAVAPDITIPCRNSAVRNFI
jgi:hypothetical protein